MIRKFEDVEKSFASAMEFWVAHDRDAELVEEIAQVALSSAEEGAWERAKKAAKAAAREAEDCIGHSDPGWETFYQVVSQAADAALFTGLKVPRCRRDKSPRTMAAMSSPRVTK